MTEREKLIELICECNVMSIPTDGFIEGLADYLLEKGVIVSPIKIGTTIWTNKPFKDGIVRDGDIVALVFGEDGVSECYVNFDPEPVVDMFSVEEIGKTIFFSKEEAERIIGENNV